MLHSPQPFDPTCIRLSQPRDNAAFTQWQTRWDVKPAVGQPCMDWLRSGSVSKDWDRPFDPIMPIRTLSQNARMWPYMDNIDPTWPRMGKIDTTGMPSVAMTYPMYDHPSIWRVRGTGIKMLVWHSYVDPRPLLVDIAHVLDCVDWSQKHDLDKAWALSPQRSRDERRTNHMPWMILLDEPATSWFDPGKTWTVTVINDVTPYDSQAFIPVGNTATIVYGWPENQERRQQSLSALEFIYRKNANIAAMKQC